MPAEWISNFRSPGPGQVDSEWLTKNIVSMADVRNTYHLASRFFDAKRQPYAEQRDWIRNVLCVPRAFQVEAFAEVQHWLHDALYWRLLGHILVCSVNHAVYLDLYRYLLKAPLPGAHNHFMRPSAARQYRSMPDTLLLFRGYGPKNKDGLYYTLSMKVAMGCAYGHGKAGKLLTVFAPKRDCFFIGEGKQEGHPVSGGIHEQVIYVPGMGAVQAVMNGSDETAKEKLRQQWRNNPPEGFTATRSLN